jgi:hypothetical protein
VPIVGSVDLYNKGLLCLMGLGLLVYRSIVAGKNGTEQNLKAETEPVSIELSHEATSKLVGIYRWTE